MNPTQSPQSHVHDALVAVVAVVALGQDPSLLSG